jgi:hypothetical protein
VRILQLLSERKLAVSGRHCTPCTYVRGFLLIPHRLRYRLLPATDEGSEVHGSHACRVRKWRSQGSSRWSLWWCVLGKSSCCVPPSVCTDPCEHSDLMTFCLLPDRQTSSAPCTLLRYQWDMELSVLWGAVWHWAQTRSSSIIVPVGPEVWGRSGMSPHRLHGHVPKWGWCWGPYFEIPCLGRWGYLGLAGFPASHLALVGNGTFSWCSSWSSHPWDSYQSPSVLESITLCLIRYDSLTTTPTPLVGSLGLAAFCCIDTCSSRVLSPVDSSWYTLGMGSPSRGLQGEGEGAGGDSMVRWQYKPFSFPKTNFV